MTPQTTHFSARQLLILLLFLSVGGESLFGQIRPDQPVRNYRVPFFDDQGIRVWEIRGEEAIWQSDDSIQLNQSTFVLFPQRPERPGVTTITSYSARLFPESKEARGREGVTLDHPIGQGSAQRWTFRESDRRLILEGEVTFFLPQTIRPLPLP